MTTAIYQYKFISIYMYISIIRDHVVGTELRLYGKNTKNYFSNEPKMSSVHALFAAIQLFEGREI